MSPPKQCQRSARRLRQHEMAEELSRIGHWYWAVGSERVSLSAEACRLFGAPLDIGAVRPEQALGMLPDGHRETMNDLVRRAVRDQRRFDLDVDIKHPDGTVRHLRFLGESDIGADGRTAGVLGVVQDLTEQRRTQAALAIANERQQDYFEMSSDWLWEMGPDLRFTYFSPRFEEATGLSQAEVVGKTRRELIGDEELSLEMEMHLAWLEQHKSFRDFRYWLVTANGERMCLSSTGKPVFDVDGVFQGYRGFARDVTAEEVGRDALMRANRQLKAANREKSEALISLKQAKRFWRSRPRR